MNADKNADLSGAVEDEVGDATKNVGGVIDLVQGFAGVVMGFDSCGSRLFHAVQGWISCFVRARVFAGCLTQILCRRSHVQNNNPRCEP